ncbi:MAG: transcriptional regulator [Lacrimispora sp.]|jgi:DNA-binding transcriptional LysR family regulator|nr:transcriptional regulator [Lacrimispora sp.]
METKHLNYIISIAQQKNMTKAAEQLFVSQSSLSQYLSRLEQNIGSPLFFRAKGELILTPAGELYVNAAKEVVQIKDRLYKNMESLDRRGHISIGVSSQWGIRLLTAIVPEIKNMFPSVTIEISETSIREIFSQIISGKLDFALASCTDMLPPEIQVEILETEEILFGIPSSHSFELRQSKKSISQKEFANFIRNDNFILSKKEYATRILAEKLFEEIKCRPEAICETNSMATISNMVANGSGVGFFPVSCANDREHIKYYSLKPNMMRYNVLLHRDNLQMNQLEKTFLSYVRSNFM